MSDGGLLLAAIRRAPDDLLARRAYADWLQEGGQEARAELVRIGVELAAPAPDRPATMRVDLFSSEEHVARVEAWRVYSARRDELDRRERELLAAADIPAPAGWRVVAGLGLGAARRELLLRRGLVERAACPAAAWVTDGDAILAEHPVRAARLATRPDVIEEGGRARLAGDPSGRGFAPEELDAVRRPGDSLAMAALRCRWPGIDFELPGG